MIVKMHFSLRSENYSSVQVLIVALWLIVKKLKLSVMALSLAVVIVAGYLALDPTRALFVAAAVLLIPHNIELRSNPINRYILDEAPGTWGTRLSLIPEPFPAGISKSEVEQQLEDAGYELADDGHLRFFQFEYDISRGKTVYSRRADDLVCNKLIFVFVGFDDKQQLNQAEAAMHEAGCL